MKQFRKEQLELIAEVMANFNDSGLRIQDQLIEKISKKFADKLYANNPDFDRQRFLRACGLEVESLLDKRYREAWELKGTSDPRAKN